MFGRSRSILTFAVVIVLLIGSGMVLRLGGGVFSPADQQAGSVNALIPESMLDRGGREVTIKLNADVNWNDLIRTLERGRVRIGLLDGSILNVGARSVFRIFKHDAQTQQSQLELTFGRMRAQVSKLAKQGASFEVRSQTAVVGVIGTEFIVVAEGQRLTGIYCVEGQVLVRNIDPRVSGQVTLRAGQFTTVYAGQPPTPPQQAPASELQSEIAQTDVAGPEALQAGPSEPGTPGAPAAPEEEKPTAPTKKAGASKAPLVLLGVGAAAAAAAGLALAGAKAAEGVTSSGRCISTRNCIVSVLGGPCSCSQATATGPCNWTGPVAAAGQSCGAGNPCAQGLSCNNGRCEDRTGRCPF